MLMATNPRMKTHLSFGVGEDAAKAGLTGIENVCEIKVAGILALGTLSPVESTLMQKPEERDSGFFFPAFFTVTLCIFYLIHPFTEYSSSSSASSTKDGPVSTRRNRQLAFPMRSPNNIHSSSKLRGRHA
jgi:hypothetical protein